MKRALFIFHQVAHASDAAGHAGRVSNSNQSPGGKTWRAPTKADIFFELESRVWRATPHSTSTTR
ncbi:hypothetical protein BCEN4_1320031 [Burkholderia cenocepacia]|uniref:hypothetical protein n=1 Tax=Burkholderia cenocepacia TaxID=95486 RepID=UPI001A3CB3FA|nr:hypothetical protein [Burkholderia cenocepacia]CAD9218770.1 hypothetical protein BCEN4_1320031 [Burkholderia cenocepacia]